MTYAIRLNAQGVIVALESFQGLDGQIEIHNDDLQLVQDYIKQNPNASKYREMHEIQAWLNANDYKVNKHLLGEYADDDERWTTYLQERADKLARYNELEGQHIDKEPFDLTLLTPLVVESEVESEELDIIDESVEDFMGNILEELTGTEEEIM